jgi:hypothetical protein
MTSYTRTNLLTLLLEPVVRVALRYGFSIQDLIEGAKIAFIKVATKELATQGEAVNVSRLSIMSGLQRRDVMRILENSEPYEESVSMITRVVGMWSTNKRFLDKLGNPKPLHYSASDNEFSALVGLISKDLNAGTILNELQRRELVNRKGSVVTLLRTALQTRDDQDALQILAEDSADLTASILENVKEEGAVNHQAKTEFDSVPEEYSEEIRKWLLQKGRALHSEIKKYLAQFDTDSNQKKSSSKKVRVAFGSFATITESVQKVSPGKSTPKAGKKV